MTSDGAGARAGHHIWNKTEPSGVLGVDQSNTTDVAVFISHVERIINHSLSYLKRRQQKIIDCWFGKDNLNLRENWKYTHEWLKRLLDMNIWFGKTVGLVSVR